MAKCDKCNKICLLDRKVRFLPLQLTYPEFYSSTNPNRDMLTFKPPLSAREIDAWETRHNVCLPEEYRSFLEQIGNGGQFYEDILPLEEWAKRRCPSIW